MHYDGGWAGFTAVILCGTALILSIIFEHKALQKTNDTNTYTYLPSWLDGVGLMWFTLRSIIHLNILAFIAPGVDVALTLAFVAVMIKVLSQSFDPDWTWQVGFRQFRCFLLLSLTASLVYDDVFKYSSELWILAAAEAAIMLPFMIRLATVHRK